MTCYECFSQGTHRETIGICHHCSVGLCAEHASLVSDPILVHEPIARVAALPKKARELLCRTCLDAFNQSGAMDERHVRSEAPLGH